MKKRALIAIIILIIATVFFALIYQNKSPISNFINKLFSGNQKNSGNSNSGDSPSGTGSNTAAEGQNAGDSGGGVSSGSSEAIDTNGPEYGGRGAYLASPYALNQSNGNGQCSSEMTCIEGEESVCGWLDPKKVVCSEGPCVKRYINKCAACKDPNVLYWVAGDCPFHN